MNKQAHFFSLKTFFGFVFFFTVSFILSDTPTFAQCAYGSCIGSSVFDIAAGCNILPGYCTQNYLQVTVNCDASCHATLSNNLGCNLTTCTTEPWTGSTNCCPGGPGDDDTGDDTTPTTATIMGRIYSDDNGDSIMTGQSELWAREAAFSCAGHDDTTMAVTSDGKTGVWQCDTGGGTTQAYYQIDNITWSSGATLTAVLSPPTGIACSGVRWDYTICRDAACSTYDQGNGTGCTATIPNSTSGFNNHLWWQLPINTPPTASAIVPGAPGRTDPSGIRYYPVGSSVSNLGVIGADTQGLSQIWMSRRPYDPMTNTDSDPFTSIGTTACSGTSCTAYYTEPSVPAGYSIYYANASDSGALSCSGRLVPPVGYSDCDPTPPPTDYGIIFGDSPPVCTAYWPTEITGKNEYLTMSVNAGDLNGNIVRYDMDWFNASLGSAPTISRVDIDAYGTHPGNNVYPSVTAYFTDSNGTRTSIAPVTIRNRGIYSFTYSGQVSMVELHYTNDQGAGGDLFVYSTTVWDASGTQIYNFPSYQTAPVNNSRLIYFDIGGGNDGFDGRSPFNGGENAYSQINNYSNIFDATNGRMQLFWGGVIRYPMLWRSSSTIVAGNSVSFGIYPRVSPSYFYDGSPCTATITSVARTISGNLYETSNPATCNTSGSLPATVTNTISARNPSNVQIGSDAVAMADTPDYTITPLFRTDRVGQVCVNGTVQDATGIWVPSCINTTRLNCTPTPPNVGCFTCTDPAVPTNGLYGGNATVDFGFTKFNNRAWFATVDGDFYGGGVIADVPPAPASFSPYIINTLNASTIGGYGFSSTGIIVNRPGTGVSELGGYGRLLSDVSNEASYAFDDGWINDHVFTLPSGVVVGAPPANNQFAAGGRYAMTLADINDVFNGPTQYTITGGTNGVTDVAFVYVIGGSSGDIVMPNRFAPVDPVDLIVLVTDKDVVVNAEISHSMNFPVDSVPDVGLAIVTSGDISFPTRGGGNNDQPLVWGGLVAARGAVNLYRDLGFQNNSTNPAFSFMYNSNLVYRLTQVDLSHDDVLNYTGLGVTNTEWNYED